MSRGNPSKRSDYRLKQLIESACEDLWNLSPRGLKLNIHTLLQSGSPINRLRLAATLYFLPLGSPFCCEDPTCHVHSWCHERLEELGDRLASDMGLRQSILIKFDNMATHILPDVKFDALFGNDPIADSQINVQDLLGRTPLIRAAQRSYTDLFESLIERGANRHIRDLRGKTAFDYLDKDDWLRTLHEHP